mgnify:CR=1 FL=1
MTLPFMTYTCYWPFLDDDHDEQFLLLWTNQIRTKLAPVREFLQKRKEYTADKRNTFKKRLYDIAMKNIEPQLAKLKFNLEQQNEKLERDYYALNKKLSERDLSPKLTKDIKLCNRYLFLRWNSILFYWLKIVALSYIKHFTSCLQKLMSNTFLSSP